MCDKEEKDAIKNALTIWGYSVKDIPKINGEKSPDLLAIKNNEKYLFEIKRKEDDLEKLKKSEIHESIGPLNTIDGIIEYGVNQLSSYQESLDYKLIWILADGEDPEFQIDQCYWTIYGIADIFDLDKTDFHYLCYYFFHSSFFKFKDQLDGIVITSWEEGKLCINNYSNNSWKLLNSELAKNFHTAVIHPNEEEKNNKAIIADFDADRKNPQLVVSKLQKKYNKSKLQYMQFEKRGIRLRSNL